MVNISNGVSLSSEKLYVGHLDGSAGELNVFGGSELASNGILIGVSNGSSGVVNISGSGTRWASVWNG